MKEPEETPTPWGLNWRARRATSAQRRTRWNVTPHGQTDLSRWNNILRRKSYVCPRWRDSFGLFLEDVGSRPSPIHELVLVDRKKGYVPGNVVWRVSERLRDLDKPARRA